MSDPIVTLPVARYRHRAHWENRRPRVEGRERAQWLTGSSFASTGWAVEDALRDQRDLLDIATTTIGPPRRTVAWGPSLGGMVSVGRDGLTPPM